MADMQTKILAAIDATAKKAGFEAVHKSSWGNRGSIYIQPQDGFKTIITLAYDFQDGSATIWTDPAPSVAQGAVGTSGWPNEMPHSQPLVAGWLGFRIKYADSASIEQVLEFVDQVIRTQPEREL